MDSANTRHPGTALIVTRWAAPVELCEDEIFSSWLVRTALAFGSDPLVFTGAIWPRWRVWTGDVDRRPPAERLATLVKMWGIAPESLVSATLFPASTRILGAQPSMNTLWPWILPVGARNRRRSGGLQYCPHCLDDDRSPYIRLHWRFAWHTVCERHRVPLLDRCHRCKAPFEPHRLTAEMQSIDRCATCKGRLSEITAPACSGKGAEFLQLETDKAFRSGRAELFGEVVSAPIWFVALRLWMDLIRRGLRGRTAAVERLITMVSLTLPTDVHIAVFETLPTAQRGVLLEGVGTLISLPFDELSGVLSEAGLSRQSLFPIGVPSIPPLKRIADALPDRARVSGKLVTQRPRRPSLPPPRSRREVERMMANLRRKMLSRQ